MTQTSGEETIDSGDQCMGRTNVIDGQAPTLQPMINQQWRPRGAACPRKPKENQEKTKRKQRDEAVALGLGLA